tara:strand:+ start:10368 stop:10748 length:381 start_codon:yes stop_codon:yes gene_type:complete
MDQNPRAKTELKKFRVKFTEHEHKLLKLISALDSKYQYEVISAALVWARQNADRILPLTFPTSASFRSIYLLEGDTDLSDLERDWNCKTNNALYTATALYLRVRTSDNEGSMNLLPTDEEPIAVSS